MIKSTQVVVLIGDLAMNIEKKYFDNIPNEVVREIVSHLSHKAKIGVARVSMLWRFLVASFAPSPTVEHIYSIDSNEFSLIKDKIKVVCFDLFGNKRERVFSVTPEESWWWSIVKVFAFGKVETVKAEDKVKNIVHINSEQIHSIKVFGNNFFKIT